VTEERGIKTSTILLVLAVVIFIGLGLVLFVGHKSTKKLEAQRDKDFGPEIKKFSASNSTQPAALVSQTNHLLIMSPKGATVLYCTDVSHCIGNGDVKENIYGLFIGMAEMSRRQSPKIPANGPSPAAPYPGMRK
jgi:hypothetical protein